jgi:hypothetical protein
MFAVIVDWLALAFLVFVLAMAGLWAFDALRPGRPSGRRSRRKDRK